MKKEIGKITKEVVSLLGLSLSDIHKPIYLGDSNIRHIIKKHPDDYVQFKDRIQEILKSPTYIGKHPKEENSIQYIKTFDNNNKIVLCAVRGTDNSVYYLRSLYCINANKLNNYIDSGTTIKIKRALDFPKTQIS